MKKIFVIIAIALLASLVLLGVACSSGSKPTVENPIPGKVIKSGPIGDKLMVTLSNDTGKLKSGEQEIMLTIPILRARPLT